MSFELTQTAIRKFRPLFIFPNGNTRRDPTLEAILYHFTDRTLKGNSPYLEGGATLSISGAADQTGFTEPTVREKVNRLLAMGVLVQDGWAPSGARKLSVNLGSTLRYNAEPFDLREGGGGQDPDPQTELGSSPQDVLPKQIPQNHSSNFGSGGYRTNARGDHRHNDEENDQSREGEGDSTSITDPDASSFPVPEAKFIEAEELRESSITADSVLLSGHDVSSEQAREPSSEPQSSQVEESPTGDPQGSQGGSQPLQNPDPNPIEWRPHPNAYELAKRKAPDINLEISITKYWVNCRKKRSKPNEEDWLSWVMQDQKYFEADERKRSREEQTEKPWYERDLRF